MKKNNLEILSVCNDELTDILNRINTINNLIKQIEEKELSIKDIDNIFKCGQTEVGYFSGFSFKEYNCNNYFFNDCKINYDIILSDSKRHRKNASFISFCPDCFLKFANEFLIVGQYKISKEVEIIIDDKCQKNIFIIEENYLSQHNHFRPERRSHPLFTTNDGIVKHNLEEHIITLKQKYSSKHTIQYSQEELMEQNTLNKNLVTQMRNIISNKESMTWATKTLETLIYKLCKD